MAISFTIHCFHFNLEFRNLEISAFRIRNLEFGIWNFHFICPFLSDYRLENITHTTVMERVCQYFWPDDGSDFGTIIRTFSQKMLFHLHKYINYHLLCCIPLNIIYYTYIYIYIVYRQHNNCWHMIFVY